MERAELLSRDSQGLIFLHELSTCYSVRMSAVAGVRASSPWSPQLSCVSLGSAGVPLMAPPMHFVALLRAFIWVRAGSGMICSVNEACLWHTVPKLGPRCRCAIWFCVASVESEFAWLCVVGELEARLCKGGVSLVGGTRSYQLIHTNLHTPTYSQKKLTHNHQPNSQSNHSYQLTLTNIDMPTYVLTPTYTHQLVTQAVLSPRSIRKHSLLDLPFVTTSRVVRLFSSFFQVPTNTYRYLCIFLCRLRLQRCAWHRCCSPWVIADRSLPATIGGRIILTRLENAHSMIL